MPGHELDHAIEETLETMYERLDVIEDERLDLLLSDGKLVIDIEGAGRFIVNRQGAAGQVWVAEPGGGWHFDWAPGEGAGGGRWLCSKRGVELFASVSELLSAALGKPVDLT